MYPISNDLLALFQGGGMQYARLTIGNSTIGNDRIKQGSFSINRYVETNESVAIGSVVAAELVFVLDNYDGAYDNTNFVGAEAYVEIGVKDSNNTVQYIPMGYFTFDEATRTKNTISLAALDRMTKFDIPVNASDLSFPYTLTNLLSRICTLCSVTKGSFGTITNSSYSVTSLPSEAKTYRDLLRWICELSGSNAYISYDGKLYLGWYGTTSQFNILPSNRTSSDLDHDTFTLTGVTILTGDNQKYTAGTNVRPITINNNPFITTTQAQSVANTLNTKLGGFSYCPFTAVMLPSPMIYPMDRATFTTADGTTVAVSVTEVTYKLNGNTSIGCKGEMQVRGRSYGLADQTFYASNIAAGAVTADKISVTDLASLRATIGGWSIDNNGIYKEMPAVSSVPAYETRIDAGRYPFKINKEDTEYNEQSRIEVDGSSMKMDFVLMGEPQTTGGVAAADFGTIDGSHVSVSHAEYYETSGTGGAWEYSGCAGMDYADGLYTGDAGDFNSSNERTSIKPSQLLMRGSSGRTQITATNVASNASASIKAEGTYSTSKKEITLNTGRLTTDPSVTVAKTNTSASTTDSAVLSQKDLTFNGDSLKRLTPHLAQMWATAIPSNANLNTLTYLAVGQYFVASNATAATFTNCPTGYSFNMKVDAPITTTYGEESGSADFYRVRTIENYYGEVWKQRVFRLSGTVTYGSWQRVITTADVPIVAASEGRVTTATTLSDTGKSITIPSAGWWAIEGYGSYSNSVVDAVALVRQGTTAQQLSYNSRQLSVTVGSLYTSYTGYFNANDVIKLYAKYAGATSNYVLIRAKRMA